MRHSWGKGGGYRNHPEPPLCHTLAPAFPYHVPTQQTLWGLKNSLASLAPGQGNGDSMGCGILLSLTTASPELKDSPEAASSTR